MFRSSVLATLALIAAGCSSGEPENPDAAVEAAIRAHLSKRTDLNMGGMDLSLDSVDYEDDSAAARVTFRAKGAEEAMLTMSYALQRVDGAWEVQSSGGEHGGDRPATPSGNLPPGHPPATEPSPELPQNHPPVKP